MMNWGDGGVQADGEGSRHFSCSIKGLGDCFFKEIMCHTSSFVGWSCEGAIFCVLWSWKGLLTVSGTGKGLSLASFGPGKGQSSCGLVMV